MPSLRTPISYSPILLYIIFSTGTVDITVDIRLMFIRHCDYVAATVLRNTEQRPGVKVDDTVDFLDNCLRLSSDDSASEDSADRERQDKDNTNKMRLRM